MDNDSLAFGYMEIKLSGGWEGWEGAIEEAIWACEASVFVLINTECKMKNKECWKIFQLVEIVFALTAYSKLSILCKSMALNL